MSVEQQLTSPQTVMQRLNELTQELCQQGVIDKTFEQLKEQASVPTLER